MWILGGKKKDKTVDVGDTEDAVAGMLGQNRLRTY